MTKKNRLKPKPENRKALQELEQSGILYRAKIGLRNIIRANTGKIEYCGHNITGFTNFIMQEPCLQHFRQAGDCISRSIHFNGRAASIFAMTDKRGSPKSRWRLFASDLKGTGVQ